MQLYRSVGLIELQLIYESGMHAFPPRLPEQPIFYPVLNVRYAAQIARDWNTKSHTFAGYVTEFVIDDSYAAQFERRVVGGRLHEELWVPAEQLAEFNQHIVGPIVVSAAYFGAQFRGYVPEAFGMKGQTAVAQFSFLAKALEHSDINLHDEIRANHLAVFLHYAFWQHYNFAQAGVTSEHKQCVLLAIESAWHSLFPAVQLPQAA